MGIVEDLGNLWSSYFSFYSRKEKEETQVRQAAKTSFVGSGLAALKHHGNAGATATAALLAVTSASNTAGASSSSSVTKVKKEGEAGPTSVEEAPICPPVFEGDYWVNEYNRVHRLILSRSKGCDGQDHAVNQRKFRDALKQLMGKPIATPFCRPVDVVKLNIPDYLTVIKRPMDLGTTRDKLRSGVYKTGLDFAQVRHRSANDLKTAFL
jgi:hypothetical protein